MKKINIFAVISILIVILIGVLLIRQSKYVDASQKTNLLRKIEFSDVYVSENENKVNVEVPMSYELLNIIIALGNIEESYTSLTNINTEYYQNVISYFQPFANHEVIQKVKALNDTGNYPRLRQIFIYCFIDNEMKLDSNYPDNQSIDDLSGYISLINDFAKKTDFQKFYYDNQDFYENEIRLLSELVDIHAMWHWLEQNFEQRYSSIKIILSPLVGGAHNTTGYSDTDSDFSEIIIFVSTPKLLDKDKYNSESVFKGLVERMIFTEMDHHYVNPTTDYDDNYIKVIKAFRNLSYWNEGTSYKKEILTFNEYMTWATFLIYAKEKYDLDDYLEIKSVTAKMMNYRKFVRFEEFADNLIELRTQHSNKTVESLYPYLLNELKN